MCIKNLPQVLVIQLKRFDYDWERYDNFGNHIFNCDLLFREMAVKFNDYFEFPKEFDLQPYTAAGLAKIEGKKTIVKSIMLLATLSLSHTYTHTGEEIPDSAENKKEDKEKEMSSENMTTKYRLRGILVHSGQASGGHYYSFILVK